MLVLFATQDLGVSTRGYGVLLGASAVGSVLGALQACRDSPPPCGTSSPSACGNVSSPVSCSGRVNSVYRMLGWGTIPLGGLAGGFIASAAGLRAPYIISGVLRGAVLLALLPALLAAARTQGPDKA